MKGVPVKTSVREGSKEIRSGTQASDSVSISNPVRINEAHYPPLDGILRILLYLVWEFWVQKRTSLLSLNRYFEIQTWIKVDPIKRYLVPFIQL